MAKLMLLLPFSPSEICVLLDLRRTENAGWNFYSLMSFYLGIWRKNEEVQRGLSRKVTMSELFNTVFWSKFLM